MGMDSMGRITFSVTLLCILHLVVCDLLDRHERRSDADDYLSALKSRYPINDVEQGDGRLGGEEGGGGGETEEKERWHKERNAKGSRRGKRNIKIFIRNNGETATLRKVKETGKLGTTRVKYHDRKMNGEWGVLRFAHASKETGKGLERSERKEKVEFSIDDGENRGDKTEKKHHITKLNIPLQRRKYQHISQGKEHGRNGTRKWSSSQGRAALLMGLGSGHSKGIHAQTVLTSPNVNSSTPTINPNMKFRDSEGNIVISHHSLRVSFKDSDKEVDKQEKSVVSSATKRESRTFHQPSLPSSHHQDYSNVQMWTSARALWPDVAKSWKYVNARKRDIELRREKRYIHLKSMRASKRTGGPMTLLVHSRRLGRHSNGNNNTTSNIHDYFRHVFIRKNNNTDTGTVDHTTPAITTTATTTLKTKKVESVLNKNVTKLQTATTPNKKKETEEEEGRVDKKPPNISNIHDFFRHVFIRKNSSNIGASQYLPTPGTIGAYDVAHGKVKNLHRKHQRQDQPQQHHHQQQEQNKLEEKQPHQDQQQQQNLPPPTKITGKSHNGHKKKKGRTKIQEVHSVSPPSKKIARKQSPPQALSPPPKHQRHQQQLQQQQKHHRIAHRKKRKPSHRGINSRVLITPTKTSQETNDITLKVKPASTPKLGKTGRAYNKTQSQGGGSAGAVEVMSDGKNEKETDEIDRKGISEEKPEDLEEQATAQAYQTSQLLRGDEPVGDAIHPLASDNLVPTYAAPAVSSEVMPGVYSSLNTATNFNLSPTPARIRWLFGNPNFNPTIANMNVPPVKSVRPSLAFLNQMRSAGMRMGTAFRNQNFLAPTPLIHGPRFQNYLKNSRMRAPARLSMQPLIQENVGYAFDESPTVGALNPMNARIIHERHLAELATNRVKAGLNPVEKKNLVQFRDHNGKVLATLRDPNTWNSANVTLSKDDDKRRYMNEWKEIQVEGAMKRGVSSSGGKRVVASSKQSSAMVRTLSPQDIINEFTPRKVPIISRKIAITTSNLSSNVQPRINSKGIRTDEDGDRVISFHAYKAPLIPLKKSDVRNTNAWGVPTTVYNAGPGISVIGKRDYIYHHPTALPASLQGEGMVKKDVITAINDIDPLMENNDPTQNKRSKQENDIATTDPWKAMEENILDDKDRAYLVELLSNLGDDARSKIDRMGTRRDDIPGGKNNHQILTKVTKFMGDVEKFIKNVEIISSTFGKDKQIPSKLIKFIVHVEKFIDDIENITTSFGKGPVKRKQKNKDFLTKLQKLVSEQTSNGQSLFDLFQSNASVVATGGSNNEMKKNVSGGNLYKETIEFLKNEIEEIEQVRNMLKAEDDRMETNKSARNGSKSAGSSPHASSNYSLDSSPSNETKTNKSNINNTPVTMDTFDQRSAFEGFNKSPYLKDSDIVNKTDEKLLESRDREQSLRVNESNTDQIPLKEDGKEIDMSTLIPVEATSANPDEVRREGKFGNLDKVEKQDDGTVFAPIIPEEEEEKKNMTFTITPATLADGMPASPTHRVDQIAGITEPIAKAKDEFSKSNISKNDVDDDDDSELAKTTADEIKKDEKIEETNLFEANDTKAGRGSEMKKTEESSHRKNPSTLHEDGDSISDVSSTKLDEKEEKQPVQVKNNDELSDNGENYVNPSTNENATMIQENNTSLSESESGNESPMVITPKLFKESIHEAIRQFAERMKLESSAIDGSSDHVVEKGNRIEKSLIQSQGNTTDTNMINSAQNKSMEIKRDNTVDEMDESQSNTTSSRLNRLVEFFLSSKQSGSASKHNVTSLIDDQNSLMKTSRGPESQEFDTLENVRKSFFGHRDENDEETVGEPVLSVAAHYAPKISYKGLQLFTDTNKKSLTMRQRAKLSAATPYDHKKEENVEGEEKKVTKEKDESPRHSQEKDESPRHSQEKDESPTHSQAKDESPTHSQEKDESPTDSQEKGESPTHSQEKDESPTHSQEKHESPRHSQEKDESPPHSQEKDESPTHSQEKGESPRHSQTNQTAEYLNKINQEMTGTAVELTPLVPPSAPSTPLLAKSVNLNHSAEVSETVAKMVPDAKPTSGPKKKNESRKRNASTSTSHATEPLAKLSVNSSRSSLVMALAQPFIFPYGKDMEKYDTPCVRRCLDDGTVLGMCVRSCDLNPVRRNVPSNKNNTVSAPVRSIHLSQPEPYSPLTGAVTSRNETVEGELEVAGPPTSSITRHMSNETEGEQAQVPPVRQFVDEEGNILEQHQDHVATLVKLTDTDKDTMSPVLTQSATFDSDKDNEKLKNIDKQTNNIKAASNDKQLENDNPDNNDKLSNDKPTDDNDLNKKDSNPDQPIEAPPDVPADVSESQNSGLTSASDENVASIDGTLEKDLCKAGFCSNKTGENGQKDHYCQDRPCFSLKDIWKMLHCSHPPCIPNDDQNTYKTPAKFSNETDQLEAKEILKDAESPVNFLTKERYNRILAEQKKKVIKDPVNVFLPSVDKINNAPSHTDADDLEKYGPLAPEKTSVETDGTILDGPNSNIPGFTGTPDAVTNRIPEPVGSAVSISNKIPEIPGVSAAVSNKIVELAGVTEVTQDKEKNPISAGELRDERESHEIISAPGLTSTPHLNHETVKKIPMPGGASANVGNVKPSMPQCSCSKDVNVACRKHCVTKEKQLSTLKAKQKATQSIIKNPIVVMIKPKPGTKGKKVASSNDQKQTFTSRVCRSWTYFPYFTCLLESPISRPYVKEKNPPFDGPYENCRTLPAFPFFKCYSNGLSEVLPAQRHKISKGAPKGTKSKALVKGGKQNRRPPVSPNIGNKMSDTVAKAMLENANRVASKINTASMSKSSKSGNQLHVKNQLNEQMKKNPQHLANVSKKQPITGGIPAKAIRQLEANKPILHKAKNTPILPIKKSMTKPNIRPNLFNVKYMLTLPQTKFFVPFKGGIAPNTNLIKPFTGLHSSSKGLARDSLPPSVFPKVRAKVKGPAPPTSIPPIKIPPRKPGSFLMTQSKQPKEMTFTNTTSRFPPWFNPKTNFNGYIRALLSQHKVKEAELFKKILRVIMSSPKSRKYNEAGGDPWKYIYPALKWVEEYENVWKPKFKGSSGKKSKPFGNGKVDSKKLTEAVRNAKPPINIPNKNLLKQTMASTEKQGGKAGIKKTIVPGTRISGLSLANQLYNTDGFVDATDKKYLLQEEPYLSLDSMADDEEIQSLGFTTGENADLSKEIYLR